MNTADPMHDQALAAMDEAARLIRSAPSAPVKWTPILSRVVHRWIGKTEADWTSCGHVDAPQVCLGLGNWPGHLMCGSCLIANAELSNNECDWCGACPQVDDRVTLHGTLYPIGLAIVIFVFCDRDIIQPDCGAYKAATQSLHT